MSRFIGVAASAVAAALLSWTAVLGAEENAMLHGDRWDLTVDPGSLAVTALVEGREVRVSGPQAGLGDVAELARGEGSLSWRLPERNLSVTCRVDGGDFIVEFTASRPGRMTWPVVGGNVARAYVLPLGEGHYVPADDEAWVRHLADGDSIDTTQGLSMPFWGLDYGDFTLTYIATNQFNNELTFTEEEGRLGLGLTHRFSRLWEVKECGYVVRLGGPSPVEPARQYRNWLLENGQFVSLAQKIEAMPQVDGLLGAAHVYLWGDGVSVEMMERFDEAGLDRLWLGTNSWQDGRDHPDAVRRAKELGYLIGPYDSYDSVHDPDDTEGHTWETAKFDRELYETGGMIKWNGQPRPGYLGRGYHLNPIVARPYVEKRVRGIHEALPERYNSWFIDCDAYGNLYDDFSELHPTTARDDANARLDRMAWIRDTYGLVIGSERGAGFAVPAIHFAHGMTTPPFGAWGDDELTTDKESPYFLGAWWPPGGPAVMVRQVPLKPRYYTFHYDPAYRLPLYQTVFHDSVITTHHWGRASLKFSDQVQTVALTELLYGVPPLYHLNAAEWEKHGERIAAHCAVFSPLHREIGALPMTDFAWLTDDRLVQRTRFGDAVEVTANFTEQPFDHDGDMVPARSVATVRVADGRPRDYTPEP